MLCIAVDFLFMAMKYPIEQLYYNVIICAIVDGHFGYFVFGADGHHDTVTILICLSWYTFICKPMEHMPRRRVTNSSWLAQGLSGVSTESPRTQEMPQCQADWCG